jgi:hypothetical protein
MDIIMAIEYEIKEGRKPENEFPKFMLGKITQKLYFVYPATGNTHRAICFGSSEAAPDGGCSTKTLNSHSLNSHFEDIEGDIVFRNV